ncbi:MAG: hypothetical protein ACI4PF_00790 [Christensenellales bacterium]
MKLVETNIKIRCDVPNCKDMAKYKLTKPGFVANAGLFLCKDCVKEIYETLSTHIVPKSPSNMLNKKISKKEKGEINEKI